MKRSKPTSALSHLLIGIALAAITQISQAARCVASQTQTTESTHAVQHAPATALAERPSADQESPLTLYLKDTNGKAFRLVQVPGTGWRYADGWKSSGCERNSPFQKTAFAANPRATAANKSVVPDEPLTVFIDGQSGLTFVWNEDEGWKFVGKLANGNP